MIEVPEYVSTKKACEFLNYTEEELYRSISKGSLDIAGHCEHLDRMLPLYSGLFNEDRRFEAFFEIPEDVFAQWSTIRGIPPSGKFYPISDDVEVWLYFRFDDQMQIDLSNVKICGSSIKTAMWRYWISSDFKSICHLGESFELTDNQSKVIKYLFNQNREENFSVRQEVVLDAIGYEQMDRRISKIFRKNGKPHPLWDKIIHPNNNWIELDMPGIH